MQRHYALHGGYTLRLLGEVFLRIESSLKSVGHDLSSRVLFTIPELVEGIILTGRHGKTRYLVFETIVSL